MAVYDWTRPASAQFSAVVYRRSVEQIYQARLRRISSHFVRCRFQPHCSDYSLRAVQARGFPEGLWLTAKRLARCQPWVPLGTYDPPPAQPEQVDARATAALR